MTSLFGTDGVRNRVGSLPFTQHHLPQFGYALGAWLRHTFGDHARVLIGYDTRSSCAWVTAALKSGLLMHPISAFTGGVLPTAAVGYLVQKTDAYDAGIIISASHNPYHDNGVKLIKKSGKLNKEEELHIEQLFDEPLTPHYDSFGRDYTAPHAAREYVEGILSFFPEPFLHGKKIVIDCAHGAASAIAQTIFEQCGARTIIINHEPDGKNINHECGATHASALVEAVIKHTADAGIALDGDADRIVMINKLGQIKDGDDILALLNNHPRYAQETILVGTVVSNFGLEKLAIKQGKQFARTAVGDKHIGNYLKQHSLLLGGEPSGHIIMRDFLDASDGIFAALRVLEVLTATDNWEMQTFHHMPQITVNLPVKQKRSLDEPELAALIENYRSQLVSGRLIIRYSGTEPLLRIMVEDDTLEHAQSIGTCLARELEKTL